MKTSFSRRVEDLSGFLATRDGNAGDEVVTVATDLVATYPAGVAPRLSIVREVRVDGKPAQRVEVPLGSPPEALEVSRELDALVAIVQAEALDRAEHPGQASPEKPEELCRALLAWLEPLEESSEDAGRFVERLRQTVGNEGARR